MKQQSVWPDRDNFIFCAGPPLQQQSSPPLVMRLLTNIRAKLCEILQVLFPHSVNDWPISLRGQITGKFPSITHQAQYVFNTISFTPFLFLVTSVEI